VFYVILPKPYDILGLRKMKLHILAPTRYPWRFNGPQHSRHLVETRAFVPFNYITPRLEGITAFNPFPLRKFDLIHSFNRIPIEKIPFIIGFESHLPRAFGLEKTLYWRKLVERLKHDNCRRIIAISRFAADTFRTIHARTAQNLNEKLEVHYPNAPIPEGPDPLDEKDITPLRITFIGGHFARKGGCVAVRLAELALAASFPLEVTIVSDLQVGRSIWTDPADPTFFEKYFRLLSLPNVTWRGRLDNKAVAALLRRSHFSLLTTFGDTFGYSAIESMANYTPVIATRQGALPEFIQDGVNGIMLDLETRECGEWVHLASPNRNTNAFERLFEAEVERLAAETFARLVKIMEFPATLWEMRCNARLEAESRFDANAARDYWDGLYEKAVGRG
jgi:glycosyltransferase involved in cell wall biosynthesis